MSIVRSVRTTALPSTRTRLIASMISSAGPGGVRVSIVLGECSGHVVSFRSAPAHGSGCGRLFKAGQAVDRRRAGASGLQ
ncbi:MAG: hypothetical protein OXG72_16865, partial [Acidobacteria bacterium]|nr:hypothetical protein [Acidobacteriota bacterium]